MRKLSVTEVLAHCGEAAYQEQAGKVMGQEAESK